jgi:3-deoxy-D-manno-octulosonic-acid transferase
MLRSFIYRTLSSIFFCIAAPAIALVCACVPKWRRGLTQKFGLIPAKLKPKKATSRAIWIHAISYGEVKTIEPLLYELQSTFADDQIFLSTGTQSGQELAKKLFTEAKVNPKLQKEAIVFYCPFDFYPAVQSWLKFIEPSLLLIAETELWPELITGAQEVGAKCFIVNARLTDRSVKRYKLFKPIFSRALTALTGVFAQSQADKERFKQIGASEAQIKVFDNLKLDGMNKLSEPEIERLKTELNISPNTKVLIGGSTHEPEEKIICELFSELLKKYPKEDFRLILAPRHLERLEHVISICKYFNLKTLMRSQVSERKGFAPTQVLLVDAMGELSKLYSVANLAFLGGTWAKVGGHNPLEAAAYNLPIFVGHHTYKIADLVEQLKEKGLLEQTNDQNQLFELVAAAIYRQQANIKTSENLEVNEQSVSRQIVEQILNS